MVKTVLGDVDHSNWRMVLGHEHIVIDYGQMEGTPTSLEPIQVQAIDNRLTQLKESGVDAIVDCTPPGYGRNLDALKGFSDRSGIAIVASTGTFCEQWSHLPDFVYKSSVDELARLFIDELGRDCGNIKVATSHGRITETERKALEAASIAHRETGASIVGHTTASMGPEQVGFFYDSGVDLGKVLISHVCAADEPFSYAQEIAASGAYVGFDRIGHSAKGPEHWVSACEYLEKFDLLDQIVLGHDSVQFFFGPDEIATHTFPDVSFIPREFLSLVRDSRALSPHIDLMIRGNPCRWLG